MIVKDGRGIIDDLGEAMDSISTEILKTIGHRHGRVIRDKDGLSFFDDVVSREVDQELRRAANTSRARHVVDGERVNGINAWEFVAIDNDA